MYRMFRVSVIHSEVTRHIAVYMVKPRCSCSGFRFVKQIILRNRSYVNMALNSRGRRMSEKIKTAIVQYLLMHLSVEAIRSKLKHFHSYMISRQGLYICITWSCEDSEELETTAYHCEKILTVTTNCTTCNIQRWTCPVLSCPGC